MTKKDRGASRVEWVLLVALIIVIIIVGIINGTKTINPNPTTAVPDSAPVAFEYSDADFVVLIDDPPDVVVDPLTGCEMDLTYRDGLASATVTGESAEDGCTVELSVGLGAFNFTEYNRPDQSTSIARGSGWSADGFAVRLCNEIGECLVVLQLPRPSAPSATVPDGPPVDQVIPSPDVAPA